MSQIEEVDEKLKGYEKIRTVGKGAFGTAVLYKNVIKDVLVVIKEINMVELTAVERQMALNEVQVLSVLNHPNIVSYFRSFERDGVLMIEMEYADGGTLSQWLSKQSRLLPEQEILVMFQQICAAIQHMHSHNILHRDLKTANVFLTKERSVKVGDFGISKAMATRAQAQTVLGTPYYISPEMCEGKQYNQKSDIWALGCILYEMACLRKAFQGSNLPALVNNIMKGQFQPVPNQYSLHFKQLVQQLLQREPQVRPSAASLASSSVPTILELLSKQTKHFHSDSQSSLGRLSQERSILYDLKSWGSTVSLSPMPLPPRIRVTELSVSNTHYIVLTSDSMIFTWGEGSRGQLGQGDTPSWRETPTPVSSLGDHNVRSVGAGDGFSVFVSDSGMLMTCGDGSYGCLGHSDWLNQTRPKLIETLLQTDITMISCGPRHVAAASMDGDLFTWGQGDGGRLGLGNERDCSTPTSVSLPNRAIPRNVKCGFDCTVVLTMKGEVLACGRNTNNKLGLSEHRLFRGYKTIEKTSILQRVKGIKNNVKEVSLGNSHTCFLTEDGYVLTVGRNTECQLGHENTSPSIVTYLNDTVISNISAGPTYSMAVSEENVLYFWGTRHNESATQTSSSSQFPGDSKHRSSETEETIKEPKEILALYASPQQVAKGNVISIGGVYGIPESTLLLIHTTVPLPKKGIQDSSEPTISDRGKHEEDSDSLGPVPDWIIAEIAVSEAPWDGYTSNTNISTEP